MEPEKPTLMLKAKIMLHAHVQISYLERESLIGCNPRFPEDRKIAHKMLDEYLDRISVRMVELETEGKKAGKELTTDGDAGFHVWPWFDTYGEGEVYEE
jgi:hypothetical protein